MHQNRSLRVSLTTLAATALLSACATPPATGKGTWFNAKGELIARDVEHLHGANNLVKATALTEAASRADGTSLSWSPKLTCGN